MRYFESDGYYAKNDPEHRRASFCHGGAAGALRLRGHVHPKRFEEVLAGDVPHTDLRLGRMRDGEHQHHPGLHVTVSASKSVSLEGLVFGERGVVRAHDEAVRETLDATAQRAGELWLAAFAAAATESNLAGAAGRHALKPRKAVGGGGPPAIVDGACSAMAAAIPVAPAGPTGQRPGP